MTKNKDDPKIGQARRIHDYYKDLADKMILEFRDDDAFIKRLSQVQQRKAIGGKIAGISIYD